MRKRIVIGLLAIGTVIAIVAVASRPDEDSIDYHRKRYVETYQGWVWQQDLANKVRRLLGQQPRWQTATNAMEHHERALIRLGYLDECTVTVSNVPPEKVRSAVYKVRSHSAMLRVEIRETNKVKIVATTKDVPRLEEVARKADVPGSGK